MNSSEVDAHVSSVVVDDLRRVAQQCTEAGLAREGARLSRAANRLWQFVETCPARRETDPIWT
ncbi:hypothetical protein [Sphingomonas sp. SUN039]|uniref:hypothetical protein n=1 Tax=Sphingomonas sp. SUN039 TaxID=2937787 RepID=UPI0021645628|nr:hypothetical protein [Sphingomonas sp. SUN039]UVO52901.1 hypothetical protein M0209_01720 [Sphingomonas sp. SUN039]